MSGGPAPEGQELEVTATGTPPTAGVTAAVPVVTGTAEPLAPAAEPSAAQPAPSAEPELSAEQAEELKRRRDEFHQLLEDAMQQNPEMAMIIELLEEIFGLSKDVGEEEIAHSLLGKMFYEEIVRGEEPYTGQSDDVKAAMERALDEALENDDIVMDDTQKQALIDSLDRIIERATDPETGVFDPSKVKGFLLEELRAIEYTVTNVPQAPADHIDYSTTIAAGSIVLPTDEEIKNGIGMQVNAPDGTELFNFAAGNITLYKADTGDGTAPPSFEEIGQLSQEDLAEKLGEGFSIQAVFHEDVETEKQYAMGYYIEGDDFSFYVGPDAIPEKIQDEVNVSQEFQHSRIEIQAVHPSMGPDTNYAQTLAAELGARTGDAAMTQQQIQEQLAAVRNQGIGGQSLGINITP